MRPTGTEPSESRIPADAKPDITPELRNWFYRAEAELKQAMNFWLIDKGQMVFKPEHCKTHTRAQLLEIAAQITERQEELAAVEGLLELPTEERSF